MSLDVYLERKKWVSYDEGKTYTEEMEELYSANITHNLNTMADEADIYYALWRPEEIGVTKAEELIPFLKSGLESLLSEPEEFRKFNPDNGWGSYERLVEFVSNYLTACKQFPEAIVSVSR